MPTTSPTLPLERELAQQICQALQGSVAETILKTAKDGSGDEYWSSRMEGHSMKVDKEILLLGCLYIVTLALYVFFEKVIVNYRPMLMPGGEGPEASFPSSHTMLVCVIMGSGLRLLKKYTKKNQTLQLVLTVVFCLILALTVAGRLLSGVHWFTDVLGGLLLSAALLNGYEGLLKLWKRTAVSVSTS